MVNNTLTDALKEFGIRNEKELDAALKKSSFSLGVMASYKDDNQTAAESVVNRNVAS